MSDELEILPGQPAQAARRSGLELPHPTKGPMIPVKSSVGKKRKVEVMLE